MVLHLFGAEEIDKELAWSRHLIPILRPANLHRQEALTPMAEAHSQRLRHIRIQAGRDVAKKEVERKGTG